MLDGLDDWRSLAGKGEGEGEGREREREREREKEKKREKRERVISVVHSEHQWVSIHCMYGIYGTNKGTEYMHAHVHIPLHVDHNHVHTM